MVMLTDTKGEVLVSRCTVCDGNQWSFVRAGRDLYQPQDEISFKLDQCLSCGQVMQNPLPTPEQLGKAYSAEYAPYRPAWKESGWPLWKILRELTTRRRIAACADMERERSYWKLDAGPVISSMPRTVRAGMCGQLNTAAPWLRHSALSWALMCVPEI